MPPKAEPVAAKKENSGDNAQFGLLSAEEKERAKLRREMKLQKKKNKRLNLKG